MSRNETIVARYLALVALLVTLAPQPSFAGKGTGGDGGSGTGDPTSSYTGAAIQNAGMQYNLDYLRATTKADQDKLNSQIEPIIKMYTQINVASMANFLEKTYGLHVYRAQFNDWIEPGYVQNHILVHSPTLKNKNEIMDNAVPYFLGIPGGSTFDDAAPGVVAFRGIVTWGNKDQQSFVNRRDGDMDYGDVPGIAYKLVTGKNREGGTLKTPFALSTVEVTPPGYNDHSIYTTTEDELFSVPSMNSFFQAMKTQKLRTLNATVVFLNVHLTDGKKIQVVYPAYSALAPILTPIIYIGLDATQTDVEQMLAESAPRIFAYNKLLVAPNGPAMPSIEEIDAALSKYPNVLAEVQKQVGDVKRENMEAAVQAAMLSVVYGTGAALNNAIGSLDVLNISFGGNYQTVVVQQSVAVLMR